MTDDKSTRSDSPLLDDLDLSVASLGDCRYSSPLIKRDWQCIRDSERVLVSADAELTKKCFQSGKEPPSFERAGPRAKLFFDPAEVTCGIVTCGGLCPGINDVIRALVLTATYSYGVKRILGFRYGYAGLASRSIHQPLELTPDSVRHIHELGGTILGSSRGPQDLKDMVETLRRYGVNILFTIGGDGTLTGAGAIAEECQRQGHAISVIGVPKTVDNDIFWVARSFGFTTAVDSARNSIQTAHVEANGTLNGIGLLKLMGRNSGFIAAHATLSNPDVNFCLIPEVPFSLSGKCGLLKSLQQRLELKRHAVIVVAEGAGQELIADESSGRDASGNVKYRDIGIFLREQISAYLKSKGMEFSIKYIDPSYIIRSLPANALDSEFCLGLGQSAVHAGMTGRTNMFIGFWNMMLTHVPFSAISGRQRKLEPGRSMQWQRVLEATGQPRNMK